MSDPHPQKQGGADHRGDRSKSPPAQHIFRPRMMMMSEYPPMETEWLWTSRLPAGQLSLIAGAAGIGKSFLTCDMAARISTTGEWPDGTRTSPGSVLLLTAEDDGACQGGGSASVSPSLCSLAKEICLARLVKLKDWWAVRKIPGPRLR